MIRRQPIYLLLDTSVSGAVGSIAQVENAVDRLVTSLREDPSMIETAWLGVITYGGCANVVLPLTELIAFQLPDLSTCGGVALGDALITVAQCADKDLVRAAATAKGDWSPIVCIVTRGIPTDEWQKGIARFKERKWSTVAGLCMSDGEEEVLKQVVQEPELVLNLRTASPEEADGFFKRVFTFSSQSVKHYRDDTAMGKLASPVAGRGDTSASILQPVHSVSITDATGVVRRLELLIGDVTFASPAEPVDLLVLSAFPNSYLPTPGTVVRRLAEIGIDVQAEARRKFQDWRSQWYCWTSGRLPEAGHCIRRLVCFEHGNRDSPEDVVGNVFRSVREFLLTADGISSDGSGQQEAEILRLPLLSTGNQGGSRTAMLAALITQAQLHLAAGLPVKRIQLVIWDGSRDLHALLVDSGRVFEENRHGWQADFESSHRPDLDLFVSYRHADQTIVAGLLNRLRQLRPELGLFIDYEKLQPGSFWKPDLIKGLGRCRQALCLITDDYAESAECMDEFHAALCWRRNRPNYLLPLLSLRHKTVERLPESLRRVQCIPAACPPLTVDEVAWSVVRHLRPDDGR